MKLPEAIRLSREGASREGQPWALELACGTTTFALASYLGAHLQQRLRDRRVTVSESIFGDLVGSIGRAYVEPPAATLCVITWSDLDPRLGLRSASRLVVDHLDDVIEGARGAAERILGAVQSCATSRSVYVTMPATPLPPLFPTPPGVASRWELALESLRWELLGRAAGAGAVVIQDPLDAPALAARISVRNDLVYGMPFSLEFAASIAANAAAVLVPSPRLKGLILDLDNTVWNGIVGDDGAEGVSWDLQAGTHAHAMLQRAANFWASTGTLVGVASKNDPAVVTEALARADLILDAERVFPIQATWAPKSESIRSILASWNIGADATVFVDDSPFELAEIATVYPGVHTLQFDASATERLIEFQNRLREWFGTREVSAEDRIRVSSLRASAELTANVGDGATHERFLASLRSELTLAEGSTVRRTRAVELINKTNQFNLNGDRLSDDDVERLLADGWQLVSVAYRDRLSELGDIAALLVRVDGERLLIWSWVLSCRAFSRRVEHVTTTALLEHFGVQELWLDYKQTPRNAVLRQFLETSGVLDESGARITAQTLSVSAPTRHARYEWRQPDAAAGRRDAARS